MLENGYQGKNNNNNNYIIVKKKRKHFLKLKNYIFIWHYPLLVSSLDI